MWAPTSPAPRELLGRAATPGDAVVAEEGREEVGQAPEVGSFVGVKLLRCPSLHAVGPCELSARLGLGAPA